MTTKNGVGRLSTRAREAFADTLGVNLGSGCYVKKAPILKIMDGLKFELQMDYSHSIVGDGFQLGAWKVSGDLYIAIAFEEETNVITVAVLDKGRYKALGNTVPMNLCDFVYKLSGDGKLESVDDYLAEMSFMTVGVWMRKGITGDWSRLEDDEIVEEEAAQGD